METKPPLCKGAPTWLRAALDELDIEPAVENVPQEQDEPHVNAPLGFV